MSGSTIQKRILLGTLAFAAAIVPITFGAKSATAQSDVPIPRVRIRPDYPKPALVRGQSGDVTLRFTIAADGATKDIEVVNSSSPIFEEPAVQALSKWRYAPPMENGNRVEKSGVQTVISFVLAR